MKIAVVGASGVVGRALLMHCQNAGISCVGLSRRPPELAESAEYTFVPLDLLDAPQCETVAKEQLSTVTHLVYAALFEKPGLVAGWREQDQMQTNLSMLVNLMQALGKFNHSLRQVSLLQGTKAYGAHIAPMNLPGLERSPRHQHENFYWLQEDYLKDIQPENSWHYTIWRPQIVFGHARRAPMNMLAAIGVYAALQKANELPLSYPGGPSGVMEATDADLLADAIMFSMDNPNFSNETFNVTNGDVFTWENVWPAIARSFDMEVGEAHPMSLSDSLYSEASNQHWKQLVQQHNLQIDRIEELVGDSFHYADALFNTTRKMAPPPAILSTIKLRQAGFHACIDTEVMLGQWFDRLRQMKVLPPLK